MNIPSPYLTMKEAAAYLRINPVTLNRWTLAQKISFGRVGLKKVFMREQLDNFVGKRKS